MPLAGRESTIKDTTEMHCGNWQQVEKQWGSEKENHGANAGQGDPDIETCTGRHAVNCRASCAVCQGHDMEMVRSKWKQMGARESCENALVWHLSLSFMPGNERESVYLCMCAHLIRSFPLSLSLPRSLSLGVNPEINDQSFLLSQKF